MKQFFRTLRPVILLALFAIVAERLIENPPYPVSPVHPCLIFLLSFVSWYCLTISAIRRSYGFYAVGLAIGFLALAGGLFPDLWLRWPEATLLGLLLTQIFALIPSSSAVQSPQVLGLAACLILAVSVLPFALTIYAPWPLSARPIIAGVASILLAGGGWMAWLSRQRKQSASGPVSIFFFVLLVELLVYASFTDFLSNIGRRQQAEVYLLFSLLLLTASFIVDQVNGELQLRSGPHMELDASLVDPLTNLANRRALELYGPQLIKQSHEAGRAVSVIMADIDHFKSMNDKNGHLAGDTVLRQTAAKLKAQVRKSDLVARYGGEEFIIILPGSPLAPSLRLAERMRSAVESETVQHDSLELKRTVSFGVATAFPEEPTSLSDLIRRADTNLYRAKHGGRNMVMADALPMDTF